jgi:hypothetical protein
MREGCKSSGASEARGRGAGERRHGEFPTAVGRRGEGGESDRWGPLGGDGGRRHHRRAAQTRSRDGFWQLRQGRAGRDGPSTCARRPAVRSRPARARLGRVGRILRKKLFLNKNCIFEYTKALEIYRRRFRRNFDMRIFPKFV